MASERAFEKLLEGYERSLAWVLDRSFLALMVAIGTVGLAVFLYIAVPKGFFPQQDTGRLNGNIIADQVDLISGDAAEDCSDSPRSPSRTLGWTRC